MGGGLATNRTRTKYAATASATAAARPNVGNGPHHCQNRPAPVLATSAVSLPRPPKVPRAAPSYRRVQSCPSRVL